MLVDSCSNGFFSPTRQGSFFPTHFAVLVPFTSFPLSCPAWRKLVYQLHQGTHKTGATCVCSKGLGDTIAPLVAIKQYRPLSQLTVRPPYPPDFFPQHPSPTPPPKQKNSTPLARAGIPGRESRGQCRAGMGGGHSRSQRAGWRAHAHSTRKTRRRTARERARVHLGSALRGSTCMRQGLADQERAHVCGGWRRTARERARAEQGGAPRGSTRAGQCGGPGGSTGMRHGHRTGSKHARAADGGERGGSTRERQRAARRADEPGRGVAPALARSPLTGGCLSVSRMARCVQRACRWWPRGGRRGDDAASTL